MPSPSARRPESPYQRYIVPESPPFDPIELTRQTAALTCRQAERKYTDFYCTGVYQGISTGYLVGCNLRCAFCWVNWSRDFPEEHGVFYSPEAASRQLLHNARKKGVKKLRISGGEPTLCKEHLLQLLHLVKTSGYLFILETNGILLGYDRSYAKELKGLPNLHLRVCIKGGNPQGFQRRTGARGEFYELPFQAIENLLNERVSFHIACMSDPRLMPAEERKQIIARLKSLGYRDYVEDEVCDPYPTTIARLKKAGIHIPFPSEGW